MRVYLSVISAVNVVAACVIAYAFAQQPSPPTPAEQAYTRRVMKEIQDNLNCSASLIAAQERIAALEAKYEPKEKQEQK